MNDYQDLGPLLSGGAGGVWGAGGEAPQRVSKVLPMSGEHVLPMSLH